MSLLCPGLEQQGLLEGMPGEAGLARLPVEEARTRAMQVRHPAFFQVIIQALMVSPMFSLHSLTPCRQWSTTMLQCWEGE